MALLAGLMVAGPAAAQLARDSDAPVDITADTLEVVNAQCSATYSGAAEALQATSRLRADTLKIFYKRKAATPAAQAGASNSDCSGQVDRMEAQGTVYYVTPEQRVRADTVVYEADTGIYTLTGNVIAVRGQDVMRGPKMILNQKTGDAQMLGAKAGKVGTGRVRTILFPNEKPAAPAAKPR